MKLLLLIVAISLTGAASLPAAVSAVSPVVDSIQPLWGPVFGGTVIKVMGSGFLDATEPVCLFQGGNPIYGLPKLIVPATVTSDSTLTCPSPAVQIEGRAMVSVSNDGRTFSSSLPFEYIQLFDVQAAKEPVLDSDPDVGIVFSVSTHVRTAGAFSSESLSVNVSYQGMDVASSSRISPDGNVHTLSAPADHLPIGDFNLNVTLFGVLGYSSGITQSVRIQRLPAKPNAVVVDHVSRGLLVSGLPFLPNGWMFSGDVGFQRLLEEIVLMSYGGFNHIMPYGLSSYSDAQILELLDTCASVGVYVQLYLCDAVQGIRFKNDTSQWGVIEGRVALTKDHPALLGYYITDDTVGGPVDLFAEVYAYVKKLDPYHPVFNTIIGSGQAWQYYVPKRTFDVPQYEVYQSWDLPNIQNDGFVPMNFPMRFVPAFICGQAFAMAGSTPAEVRLQSYLSIIHNGTGLLWFDYWDWTIPAYTQMYSAASTVALELGEVQKALMSPSTAPPSAMTVVSDADVRFRSYAGSDGCVFLLVANAEKRPISNVTVQGLSLNGTSASPLNVVVPFEDRSVMVSSRSFSEPFGSYETRVYAFHCEPTPVSSPEPESKFKSATENLVGSPSFEEWVLPGKPSGWIVLLQDSAAAVTTAMQPFVAADSSTAVSGRHSGRVMCPSPAVPGGFIMSIPKVFAGNDPYTSPLPVSASTTYDFSVWARGGPTFGGTQVSLTVLLRHNASQPETFQPLVTFTLQTVNTWTQLSAKLQPPLAGGLYLKVVSPSVVWLDDVQVISATSSP